VKFKWTSSNKYLIKFIVSLFIIGIVFGFIFYSRETNVIKTDIINELSNLKDYLPITRQNNFLYHIILLSILGILSLIVAGFPLLLFYFFYEAVSFGFLLGALFHMNTFEGLLFGVIFALVYKLFLYLALMYLIISSFHYSKKIIILIKNKDYRISDYIANHLFKIVFIFLAVLLTDLIIYFFGNKIVSYFLFLL